MDSNSAWNNFVNSGKIADYLEYRKSCSENYMTIGDSSNNADKNGWNSNKTTENQRQ